MDCVDVVDGAVIRSCGSENAQTLVFLHCFGDTGYSFEKMFSGNILLNYHLVAPDLWGFGASPRREDVNSVSDYSAALEQLINNFLPDKTIGLIGHSIMAAMAVEMAGRLGDRVNGLFSIEGCLTSDDTFYPGKASDYDDPYIFKRNFLNNVWTRGNSSIVHRHFYSGAAIANARSLWELGRDSHRISADNQLGNSYKALTQPSLYYWSRTSTPSTTQDWIESSGIDHQVYAGVSHWPMVEQPDETAFAIKEFFHRVPA